MWAICPRQVVPGASVDSATTPSCEHAVMAAYSISKNGFGHLCSYFSFYVTEELCLQSKVIKWLPTCSWLKLFKVHSLLRHASGDTTQSLQELFAFLFVFSTVLEVLSVPRASHYLHWILTGDHLLPLTIELTTATPLHISSYELTGNVILFLRIFGLLEKKFFVLIFNVDQYLYLININILLKYKYKYLYFAARIIIPNLFIQWFLPHDELLKHEPFQCSWLWGEGEESS